MQKMTKQIMLTDEMFYGAISLERTEKYIRPWRLPFDKLNLFPSPNDGLQLAASSPAGVRIRCKTSASTIGLTLIPYVYDRKFDLVIDNELVQTSILPANAEQVIFDNISKGEKIIEIWLPQRQPVLLRSLLADDEVAPAQDDRKKWITYGSSITHCGEAHSPSRTWLGVVARKANFNLTCLGYGGQCHIEPMIARMIRDRDVDFISLKLGINVFSAPTLSPRTFKPAIIGMVQIIREKHPEIPIAVISPIVYPKGETTPNPAGVTIQGMRMEVADAVQRLIDAGDRNIYYFSGLDLFGEDLVEKYQPDQCHPNGDGYEILAENFLNVVLRRIGLTD